MNRPGILTLALSLAVAAPVFAGGAARARYSIELSDGRRIAAVDAPVVHGSVVTFRTADGNLTGVPREMVVRVASFDAAPISANTIRALQAPRAAEPSADATIVAPQGLQPGEVLVLGPITDSAPSIAEQAASAGAIGSAAANGGNGGGATYNGAVGVGGYAGSSYGGAVNPNAVNPNLYIAPRGTVLGPDGVPRVLSSTDLERAQAAQTPIGPNGFPVMNNGAPTVLGPNGTPTLAPGVPGSGTLATGPNGTPITGSTGPTGAFPPIGPNGTPVLAPNGQPGSVQPGQPGSAQPVIGPNGTPVLAPNGQPGSAQPNTAPNGTPGSAAPTGGGAPPSGTSGNAGGPGR